MGTQASRDQEEHHRKRTVICVHDNGRRWASVSCAGYANLIARCCIALEQSRFFGSNISTAQLSAITANKQQLLVLGLLVHGIIGDMRGLRRAGVIKGIMTICDKFNRQYRCKLYLAIPL